MQVPITKQIDKTNKMKIESVDFFYLSMPEVLDVGDGSQDALLVRVRAGGMEGWGECEAAPLPSIAAYVCPMSHSACKPVKDSIEGMHVNDASDIVKIGQKVHENSFDLLQTDHTFSGIDMALWDLLGKHLDAPVYEILGYKKAYPKTPYASQLFGNTPEETYQKAKQSVKSGFKAVKFGWGPIGKDLDVDNQHFRAAREGLGKDIVLMVDIGTVWGDDVISASKRLEVLNEVNVHWLEEPFSNLALDAYSKLSMATPRVPLAGGEGCNNFSQASAMVNHGGIKFLQIDTGRIGGITPAKRLADLAAKKRVTYVNHTFTSHLALSASLQPYAGLQDHVICEYPVEPKQLALDITSNKIEISPNFEVEVPERPGLGMTINNEKLKKYLLDVQINIGNKNMYTTPDL